MIYATGNKTSGKKRRPRNLLNHKNTACKIADRILRIPRSEEMSYKKNTDWKGPLYTRYICTADIAWDPWRFYEMKGSTFPCFYFHN